MNQKKFFVIIAMLLAVLSLVAMPTISATDNGNNAFENEILKLVNEERAKHNLKALSLDSNLVSAAKIRSGELNKQFSHIRPNGKSYTTLSSKIKAENIGKYQTTPKQVMNAWMNSKIHRNNILNPKYTTIGISYTKSDTHYWVQLFGEKKSSPKIATPSVKVSSGNKKAVISWNKVTNAKGYQIYRATSKNGKYTLKKSINSASTVKFTDKSLKKQTYHYKVRSYTTVNNVKVYSKFSTIKSVRVK